MSRFFIIGAAISSIVLGVFLSHIPRNLGLYRWIAEKYPENKGHLPCFNHGLEEGYSYEELRKTDLSGQIALVTGSSRGLGFETAKTLAQQGASVSLACRDMKKCQAAVTEIKAMSVKGSVEAWQVDTSSMQSVLDFSLKYREAKEKLDIFVQNAGIYTAGNAADGSALLSVDGIEMVFATNVVGHHLMYKLIEPLLKKAPVARVVAVSSSSSIVEIMDLKNKIPTNLKDLNDVSPSVSNSGYSQLYGRSKLAQVYWAQEITERLGKDSSIFVNSIHPGMVYTGIHSRSLRIMDLNHFPGFLRGILADLVIYLETSTMWSVADGALTPLYLCCVSAAELASKDLRGKYFHPIAKELEHPFGSEIDLQKRVWAFLDELVKDVYVPTTVDVKPVFEEGDNTVETE